MEKVDKKGTKQVSKSKKIKKFVPCVQIGSHDLKIWLRSLLLSRNSFYSILHLEIRDEYTLFTVWFSHIFYLFDLRNVEQLIK